MKGSHASFCCPIQGRGAVCLFELACAADVLAGSTLRSYTLSRRGDGQYTSSLAINFQHTSTHDHSPLRSTFLSDRPATTLPSSTFITRITRVDMATSSTNGAVSAADWITELDCIDPTCVLGPVPFETSILGRLPTELQHDVLEHLNPPELAAVVRISPKLRAVAEKILYQGINISYLSDGFPTGRPGPYCLWTICRAVSRRPDLAEHVKSIYLEVLKRDICVPIAISAYPSRALDAFRALKISRRIAAS